MNKVLLFILLVSLLPPAIATPSNGTVTRSFSTSSIGQGETFTVILTPGGFVAEGFYQIQETIPEGFTFNSANSDDVNISGRDIIFTKMSGASLRYTLTPSTTGTFTFSGIFTDNDRNNGTTEGSDQVTVSSQSSSLNTITRELSKNYTYLENTTNGITVTLRTKETGLVIYGIVETIPENLTLSLIDNSSVNMTNDGTNNYTFITFGIRDSDPILLQYILTPTSNTRIGNHTITGYFKSDPNTTLQISPDTTFRVVSNLFQAYDINDDNKLQKNEVMSAVWDYFTIPTRVNFDGVAGLIKQYLGL